MMDRRFFVIGLALDALPSVARAQSARNFAVLFRRRPNPSPNRTPAGGLSPARQSPVSLLR